MKRLPLLALLALAACSPEPAATRTSSSTTPPAPPPVDEVARLPMKKSVPAPARAPSPAPAPPTKPEEPEEIHLPAFTFRTMDHQEVKVELNGEPMSTTPCLW